MDWVEFGRAIQPWATIGSAFLTTFGVFIAARSLRITSKTNKAKFAFELSESFLKEARIQKFWSRLNYDADENAWKFDLAKFRHSDDERDIDTILYKFMAIGHMIRCGAISAVDVKSLYFTCRQLFHNSEARDYLMFVQIDTYMSDGFTGLHFGDALYCYEQMTRWAVKTRYAARSELTDCRNFIAELQRVSVQPQLRKAVATRIGYAPRIPSGGPSG